MKRLLLCALMLGATTPAHAQDFESMTLATNLGSVLASEDLCELTYNQDAISAFIEKEVDADDMSFPSTLQVMVQGQDFQNQSMSASAKTAHCAQIKRVARSYGFTE